MTLDYIAFHAAERPEAVAFLDSGRAVTYSQFCQDIRRCMRGLQEFGLNRGSSVGVGCADIYLHWVLLLGFERLGIATASLHRVEGPDRRRLLESLDLVMSEWDFPGHTIVRRHAIAPGGIEVFRALPEISEDALPVKGADDIVRILGTTGTTGDPKLLRSPRRTQNAWVDRWIWSLGFTKDSRYLMMMPFEAPAAHTWANAVICAGGTVILEPRMHSAHAISRHAITHTALFPIHLKAILDTLPQGFVKPPNLSVTSLGAPLSQPLRESALTRLASNLTNWYGTNEVGLVAEIGSAGYAIATVLPFAQVEVVDEHGAQLPMGQIGRLRIKTPAMHTEYFEDPETTSRMFKNGWFQPGDLAILHGARRIQLMGRADEVLNIGGNKMAPSAVEEMVLRLVDARDAGVVSLPNREGIEEIWIAVVDARIDDALLLGQIEQGLRRLPFAIFHVVRLPEIPRNPGGKIQRELLRRAVADAREILR